MSREAYLKKNNIPDIGLIEIILWALLMYVLVYAGIAGMDRFENTIYTLVEKIM